MAPALLLLFLSPALLLVTAADEQGGRRSRCPPMLCGKVNISFPFGIVPDQATDTNCGDIGFQVQCFDGIPYLGYNQREHWFRILDIFYDNASLIIIDIHKIQDLNNSLDARCHIPTNNNSNMLALPFSIGPLNQELIFYDCTEAPPGKEDKEGLVETGCHNNTFVRAGGRYDDEESGRGQEDRHKDNNDSADDSSWKLAPSMHLCADMASEGPRTTFPPLQNDKQQQ